MVYAEYTYKTGKDVPEHAHVEIQGNLELTKGWFNSKHSHKETAEEGISFDDLMYQGEGDWRKALDLCIKDMTAVHLSTIKSRRLTTFGQDNTEEIEEKAPKRICAIITDDQAMCDKDEKPDGAGDVGNIGVCKGMVSDAAFNDIHIVLLSKSPSNEA